MIKISKSIIGGVDIVLAGDDIIFEDTRVSLDEGLGIDIHDEYTCDSNNVVWGT